MDKEQLAKELIRDEGLRLDPYKDTVGKLTIGVGRNLDDRGISKNEAFFLLDTDVEEVIRDLDRELPWWKDLSNNGQRALANMCFNLGITKLLGFKRMLLYLNRKRYALAAEEALNSKWARQVGSRANRIADLIRHG